MSKVAEKNLKILLIGAAAVGKTSLVNQFVSGKFRKDYVLTIGMEPYTKYEEIDGKTICYTIFDIAGQQQFSKLRRMFYRGSRGALVVFDLTRRETFEEVEKWIEDASSVQDGQEFILVGNKSDLADNREVKTEEGQALADRLECISYFETSAKTGNFVNQAFNSLGTVILEKSSS